MIMCASTPSTAAEPVFQLVDTVITRARLRCLAYGLAAILAAGCDDKPPTALPVSVLDVPAGCDLAQGCRATGERISLQVQFDAPAVALQPFPISLHISSDTVMLTFSMRGMDMGLNRYRLSGNARSGWKGNVTLPICVSGRSDWIALFELTTATRKYQVQMPFVLQK